MYYTIFIETHRWVCDKPRGTSSNRIYYFVRKRRINVVYFKNGLWMIYSNRKSINNLSESNHTDECVNGMGRYPNPLILCMELDIFFIISSYIYSDSSACLFSLVFILPLMKINWLSDWNLAIPWKRCRKNSQFFYIVYFGANFLENVLIVRWYLVNLSV